MSYDINSLSSKAQCIISADQVQRDIQALSKKINEHYQDEEVVVWTVMNGALVFGGMLVPSLQMPILVDYVHATRYQRNTPGEHLHWLAKPNRDVSGKHVLICDDIFDAGITLQAVRDFAISQNAKSVCAAVMAMKQVEHSPGCVEPEFVAFEVPDKYIFGMGMDCKDYWRNAPGIWIELD